LYRFGDGDPQRLPEPATALVADGVDVIVTEGLLTIKLPVRRRKRSRSSSP
jgi:hypothetical protein